MEHELVNSMNCSYAYDGLLKSNLFIISNSFKCSIMKKDSLILISKYLGYPITALKLCFILIICFQYQSIFSQNTPHLPTARASSFGKYVDAPVSHFTGTSNVSVPISNVNDGPLSHSVSLDYHTGGIRVGEVPGVVGLGWHLSAGGAISRTTRGLPDDHLQYGYLYHGSSVTTSPSDIEKSAIGELDTEPDVFTYNFDGYTGKFFIDNTQDLLNVHFVPQTDKFKMEIRVEDDFGAVPPTKKIVGFIIVAPNGNRYLFGKHSPGGNDNSLEHTEIADLSFTITWNLERIETFDGKHAIDFIYDDHCYKFKSLTECQLYKYDDNGTIKTAGICEIEEEDNEMFGSKLVQIKTTSEEINFVYTGRSDLYEINSNCPPSKLYKIRTDNGHNCIEHTLTHDYFTDPQESDENGKRLRLTRVEKTACHSNNNTPLNSEAPWIFNYHSDFFPKYTSKRIDHWGYYNGATANDYRDDLIPPSKINNVMYGGASRNSNESAMREGALTKVTFPTGGSLMYSYEANSYSKESSDPQNIHSLVTTWNCSEQTVSVNKQLTQEEINSGYVILYAFGGNSTCSQSLARSKFRITGIGGSNSSFFYELPEWFDENPNASSPSSSFEIYHFSNFGLTVPGLYKIELITEFGTGQLNVMHSPGYENTDCGGLRVSQTRLHDGISSVSDIIKTYDYGLSDNNLRSSGFLNNIPKYATSPKFGSILTAIFNSTSVKPLTSFEGLHVGYEKVKVINGLAYDNVGSQVFEFIQEMEDDSSYPGYFDFPSIPTPAQVYEGNLKNAESFRENETTPYSQQEIIRNTEDEYSDTNIPGTVYAAVQYPGYLPMQDWKIFNTYTEYSNRTSLYRPKTSTTTLDGLTTVMTYDYESSNHYNATKITTINSDDVIYEQRVNYTSDYSGPLSTVLDHYNIIAIPFESNQFAKIPGGSFEHIDGTKTIFSNYSDSGEKLPSHDVADFPRPYKIQRYERTWDENGGIQPGSWMDTKTIEEYSSHGLIAETSMPGVIHNTTYGYDGLKRLLSKTYDQQSSTYHYHGESQLLDYSTDVNGLTTSYIYDELNRLSKLTDDCTGVFTEYNYYNETGPRVSNIPNDYIETIQNFTSNTAHASCAITDISQKRYVDGLGRNIENILLGQHPDGSSDIINAVFFDQYSRNKKSFLPFTSSGGGYVQPSNSWGFTKNKYENSPHSRLENSNPPGALPGNTIAYGANDISDNVIKIGATNPYATNSLSKVAVTNGDGDKKISFKDKLGRLILQREESADGSQQKNTYYEYDLKGRLITVYPAIPDGISGDLFHSIDENVLFKYTYYPDDKEKTAKLPDSEYYEYVYNTRGQLVAFQDGNLRQEDQWIVSNYDDYNRLDKTYLSSASIPQNESVYNISTLASDIQLSHIHFGDSGIETNLVLREETRILDSDDWLIQEHNYDNCGRLSYTEFNNHINPLGKNDTNLDSRMDYIYDQTNSVIETHLTQVDGPNTYNLKQRDIKDHAGRVIGHEINWDNSGWRLQSETEYNERGEVVQNRLGKVGSNWLQTVDYKYKDWGALESINDGTSLGNMFNSAACGALPSAGNNPDLFSLKLHYDVSPYNNQQLDGNIALIQFGVAGRASQDQAFFYDYMNRLTDMVQTGFSTSYTYDDKGNIQTLTREGLQLGANGCYTTQLIDNLTYNYGAASNQLINVTDAVDPCPNTHMVSGTINTYGTYATQDALFSNGTINPSGTTFFTAGNTVSLDAGFSVDAGNSSGSFVASTEPCTNGLNQILEHSLTPGSGFLEDGGNFSYDLNGNMIYDPNRNVTYKYNHLNLVKEVEWDDGRHLYMTYDANGTLLSRKTEPNLDPMPPVIISDIRDYLGPIEIYNGTIEAVYHDSGRLGFEIGTLIPREEFSLTDHLGNTRILFSDLNGNGTVDLTQDPATTEILQENHYYPYGMRMSGPWIEDVHSTENYQYNGMEYVGDYGLGLNMTTYRNLDPTLGVWTSIDPKAASFYTMSPYSSMGNNPISIIDPDGDFITWGIGNGGFSIGFNLTPIGIPLGAGINLGFNNGGSVGVYGEAGLRVGGTGFGSGATVSQSFDYGFRNGWSTSTTVGVYASYGGANASASYGTSGWGVSAGVGVGNDQSGIGFNIGYGSGSLSYGAGGYHNSRAWDDNPIYNPEAWNDDPVVQGSNNCYSYACESMEGIRSEKGAQPGLRSGEMVTTTDLDVVLNASIRDSSVKKPNFWNKLGFGKKGYYSVYLVVDNTKPNIDYHWYRQDKGGLWSHKPGLSKVRRIDASGKLIRNPARANHNYGRFNYRDGGVLLWAKKR